MNKYYFGPDTFYREKQKELSLGVIGLLERYSSMTAFNRLEHPWITIDDICSWCMDDRKSIENYIQEGVEKDCLIEISENEAERLQKDPFHNCWLYE